MGERDVLTQKEQREQNQDLERWESEGGALTQPRGAPSRALAKARGVPRTVRKAGIALLGGSLLLVGVLLIVLLPMVRRSLWSRSGWRSWPWSSFRRVGFLAV